MFVKLEATIVAPKVMARAPRLRFARVTIMMITLFGLALADMQVTSRVGGLLPDVFPVTDVAAAVIQREMERGGEVLPRTIDSHVCFTTHSSARVTYKLADSAALC